MSSDNTLQTPARPAVADSASARQQPAADHTGAPRAPGAPDARAQPSPGGAAPATPPPARRKHLVRALVGVFAFGIVGWGIWYALVGRWYEATDNAYAQGNVVELTPQVTGTVVSIDADDGNLVRAGTPLVRLDASDAQIALAAAQADLAATVRKVRGLYSNERGLANSIDGARADLDARRTALDKAKADYRRREDLGRSGAISREELAHALDTLTSAQSAYAAAQSALATLSEQHQTSKALVDDTAVASHPDVQAAASRLRAAYLARARTDIVAPVTGYVAKRTVQVGQRVSPGVPLLAVVPLRELWVDANFTEKQLEHMRIGQPVELTADLYGDAVRYTGRVQSLGVGTGSAFSLLPAQNATGNWIKIVQRLPVRIELTDPAQLDAHPLRIGLSMHARVDQHDRSGAMLSRREQRSPVFRTDVYRDELARADSLIADVVHANLPAAVRTERAQ
ncbi:MULTISPECIES: efflux RND transporter periplasmic adaptor subunit [Burkholderia]|uniref:efflux RND transporter periplasmic adaptor subunit n=1 Tax=Burkholderia TaxID=32008 RepID=UPI0009F3506A|nr:HlyD family efflux transporter periplasmic adaptor subunit [Burkholderia seminalis]MCA8428342.1 efflux RND transporter periplasmic adaptor subunit [Burkholderia seminalis]MCA8429866.1 efflux RND transporter periplasmic adaptor subunit [Burkholderia seminalis]RQS84102.1 HlyD family efflux transporter periplasmic adaptor subunit [Burkholderia seminalis]